MQLQIRPLTGNIIHDSQCHFSPLIKRVLAGRDIDHADSLQFSLQQLHPIPQLGSVEAAADLLAQAIQQQHHILIVGDYDADGATATALSIRALHMMGHQQVSFLVPDRFKYGYGLTPEIVDLARHYQPWLIMTVDNGVSSIEGVEAAKAQGYKTLITDHHLPGQQLPDCDVMVNPNLRDDDFPSKYLAGVGVVFYVMLALKKYLSNQGYFARQQLPEPQLTRLLDLVALGTVADVVPLDANNRILVEQGLRRLRAGQGHAGIHALLEQAKRPYQQIVSSDLGFACGPRLNAAGRLADMTIGIRCLLSDDAYEARQLATELDGLNIERKRIEADMKQDAEALIQGLMMDEGWEPLPPVICLHQADWHEGVIGILASRIKDRYYRPVIAFADSDNGLIKGSARSIAGLHMRDLIDTVASRHPGMIARFGGHAMAAGLTLPAKRLPDFAAAITEAVFEQLQPDTFREVIYTDGELTPEEMHLHTAEELQQLAPWGQWFPEPQFQGEFEVLKTRILKDLHLKMELQPLWSESSNSAPVSAIYFFADMDKVPAVGRRVQLVYQLQANEFRGYRSLQLKVVHLLQ